MLGKTRVLQTTVVDEKEQRQFHISPGKSMSRVGDQAKGLGSCAGVSQMYTAARHGLRQKWPEATGGSVGNEEIAGPASSQSSNFPHLPVT